MSSEERANDRPGHEVALTQLTPLAFLGRAAAVFPDKTAVVMGESRVTYRDFAAEVTRLARALQASGISPGDRVAYLCPNVPELLAAHFAVPLAGAVLVALNTRLSADEVLHPRPLRRETARGGQPVPLRCCAGPR